MVTRVNESGEQYYFASLDDLMMFLLKEFENRSKSELPIVWTQHCSVLRIAKNEYLLPKIWINFTHKIIIYVIQNNNTC